MKALAIVPYYFNWHYTTGFKNLFVIWNNYLWFIKNYFAIFNNLVFVFSPYRKVKEGVEIKEESLVVRIIMRIVGTLFSLMFLVTGSFAYLLVLFLGLIAFVLWAFLPFILTIIFIFGLIAIFL